MNLNSLIQVWINLTISSQPIKILFDLIKSEVDVTDYLSVAKLLANNLWEKIQDGVTLADIETVLFFMLFFRFILLAIRYNLKTSFYITCIGIFAGALWYQHLIDLISIYRSNLLSLPFLNKLGGDILHLRDIHRQMVMSDIRAGENVRWSNPVKVLYYAFTKGIVDTDTATDVRYYIDPISMAVSIIDEPIKSKILPYYYKIYNEIIPDLYKSWCDFWVQLAPVVAYTVSTRIGKRWCPYLIRWHWTFILIIGFIEQIFMYLLSRMFYFQVIVLVPEAQLLANATTADDKKKYAQLLFQISTINSIMTSLVVLHIAFVIFALFHAILGQYFYVPFFVENTELHIGPRIKNSIYSGGYTAWQDRDIKERKAKRFLPQFWYGWFGRGTKTGWNIFSLFRKLIKKILDIVDTLIS